MFNIFNQDKDNRGYYEERNHQDNFYSDSSYNNNFQYCRSCGKYCTNLIIFFMINFVNILPSKKDFNCIYRIIYMY